MVDIIPKPIKDTPRWQIFLFYISVLVLIVFVVVYFVINSLDNKSKVYKITVENQISEGKSDENVIMEKDVLAYKQKIENFIPYFNNHVFSTNFFSFIDANTHPKVFFYDTSLNTEDNLVDLSGDADSFLTLGQQMLILQNSPQVQDVTLGRVSIPKQGGIEFTITVTFKPGFFQK